MAPVEVVYFHPSHTVEAVVEATAVAEATVLVMVVPVATQHHHPSLVDMEAGLPHHHHTINPFLLPAGRTDRDAFIQYNSQKYLLYTCQASTLSGIALR